MTRPQPDQPQYQAEKFKSDNNIDVLHSASNATDQAAITAGQIRGASALLAFDEAWNKAAQTTAQAARSPNDSSSSPQHKRQLNQPKRKLKQPKRQPKQLK
jgi:hypothetical protein